MRWKSHHLRGWLEVTIPDAQVPSSVTNNVWRGCNSKSQTDIIASKQRIGTYIYVYIRMYISIYICTYISRCFNSCDFGCSPFLGECLAIQVCFLSSSGIVFLFSNMQHHIARLEKNLPPILMVQWFNRCISTMIVSFQFIGDLNHGTMIVGGRVQHQSNHLHSTSPKIA